MKLTFEEVVLILQSTCLSNYMTASIVLLVYDYMLTLDSELLLIWASRWNLVKALFLLVRYMPFIDMALLTFYLTRNGTAHTAACGITFQTSAWLFAVGTSVAEILLTIRTWACWDKAQWLTIGLPIFFLVNWAIVYVFLGLFIRSVEFIRPPRYANPAGCFHVGANPIFVACWAAIMVYHAGLLLLMGIRGFSTLNGMRKETLSKVVYRDGLIYYFLLFGLSLGNLVIIVCLPYRYVNLFTTLERVMYSVLTCRAILHIRKQNMFETTSWSFDLSV